MEEKVLLQNSCGGFPYPVTTQGELETFSCGDKDLDDFFSPRCFPLCRTIAWENKFLKMNTWSQG